MRRVFKFVFSRMFFCACLAVAEIAAIVWLCLVVRSALSFAAAAVCAYALSAGCVVALVNAELPPEYKCAWLALIAALPIVGCLIYLLALPKPSDKLSLPPSEICGYQRAQYFPDGASYFAELLKCIGGSRQFVYLEYFIIADGEVFKRLFDALKRAQERGVLVHIVCDGLNSRRLPKRAFRQLEGGGAKIKIFHKLAPYPISRLNVRDHRKIAAIDGRVAFIGGVNLADEYANINSPFGYWKDCGVAIYGEGATQFADNFKVIFDGATAHEKQEYTRQNGKKMLPLFDCPPQTCGAYEGQLVREIERSERRFYAFTPYLCLDERIKSALVNAAKRGVDVKIIIPRTPDKKLTYEITKTYSAWFVKRGVGIYLYTPGFMHAKCVIADDCTFIGSYNLDYRSLHLNYECGAKFDGDLTTEVLQDFESCLNLSTPFTDQNPTLPRRLTRSLLTLLAPLV